MFLRPCFNLYKHCFLLPDKTLAPNKHITNKGAKAFNNNANSYQFSGVIVTIFGPKNNKIQLTCC